MPTEPNPTEASAGRLAKAPPPAPEFVGVVTSRKSSVISSQVQAPLVKLSIHTGQLIKAGDQVAQLDETELRTRLEQARANEQSAQMEAGSAGAQVGALRQKMDASAHLHALRVEPMMAVKTATAEFHAAAAGAAAAAAKAAAARTAREQAENDLAKAQISSPLGGIVTNIKAHEGEVAQIGTPLARVFDPSDLIIRFAVPREHRAELRLGQRVELAVEGDSRLVWATVTNISGAQEPPINFTVVEADIDDTKLAPGELRVAAVARVRIAEAERGAKR